MDTDMLIGNNGVGWVEPPCATQHPRPEVQFVPKCWVAPKLDPTDKSRTVYYDEN